MYKYFYNLCLQSVCGYYDFLGRYNILKKITYMKSHLLDLLLLHDTHILYIVLCWRKLHNSHRHHSCILHCWIHHYRIHSWSILLVHHNLILHNKHKMYKTHPNHNYHYRNSRHHQIDSLHCLWHHHNVHLQSNVDFHSHNLELFNTSEQ